MPVTIKENISLAPHTIYKIGGPARYFVETKNSDELKQALDFVATKKVPIFVLGAGSNILVSDKGFDGLVIRMAGGEVKVEGERLTADAGVMMAQAVLKSAQAALSGFEWAIGVPGTIGGSVRGNAGCFGAEMKDVVESVKILDLGKSDFPRKSDFLILKNTQCEFSYRDSIFKKHPEWIILSATLKLQKGDPAKIQEKIKRITAERAQKQDIGTKSCGCIFKNISWAPLEVSRPLAAAAVPSGQGGPLTGWARKDINKEKILSQFPELEQFKDQPNVPASFLIDRAGLKGKSVGHVFISPKHANYFVNEGGATAEGVVTLIGIAKDTVRHKYELSLEEEIQYVGF
ncbi:MAG: UDP-N-acetylmuramate dehydrogenase [Candidatus Sungiibacteriota bacterium]|uniref:UDP-N-acetylenolpyruvoylglucosamine reductase n=1 Tax=Candidatus Sungiibacteriota bacterium TaxID=2750080 RepID=A0A7T5RJG5_9BACT|nr:MAG: UDP-N-acetylmuramate dehydrogenase [Candidatus Sungbacteria bacterium]